MPQASHATPLSVQFWVRNDRNSARWLPAFPASGALELVRENAVDERRRGEQEVEVADALRALDQAGELFGIDPRYEHVAANGRDQSCFIAYPPDEDGRTSESAKGSLDEGSVRPDEQVPLASGCGLLPRPDEASESELPTLETVGQRSLVFTVGGNEDDAIASTDSKPMQGQPDRRLAYRLRAKEGRLHDVQVREVLRRPEEGGSSSVGVSASLQLTLPSSLRTELKHVAGSPHSWRAWWTKATAIEPSPTADATRLTLPARTSPTAKTPGWLVSSG